MSYFTKYLFVLASNMVIGFSVGVTGSTFHWTFDKTIAVTAIICLFCILILWRRE